MSPSIRASANPNLRNWQPLQTTPAGEPYKHNPPPAPDPLERSPFMHASMPLMASTGDALVRQFYGQSNLPQQRILPAKRGGGA